MTTWLYPFYVWTFLFCKLFCTITVLVALLWTSIYVYRLSHYFASYYYYWEFCKLHLTMANHSTQSPCKMQRYFQQVKAIASHKNKTRCDFEAGDFFFLFTMVVGIQAWIKGKTFKVWFLKYFPIEKYKHLIPPPPFLPTIFVPMPE